MIWTLSAALMLALGCGESGTQKAAPSTPTKSETKAPSNQPDVTVSAKWKDGTNDANRGDKQGKVRLQGSIPAADGTMLYLYETEGRNLTLMDSAKVLGQAFDFGQVDVHRGFYQMATKDAKNNCQFIMNPDEANLNLSFRSKMMTSGKTAPQSAENKAWFTYETFARVNNNQIRNLRTHQQPQPGRRRHR